MGKIARPRDPLTILADLVARVRRLERSHGSTDVDGALRTTKGVNGGHVGSGTPTGGQSGDIKVGNGKIWVNDRNIWKSAPVS